MSTLELALNMLAEATTTELTKVQDPQGLKENLITAKQGGEVAGNARAEIENKTNKPVITSDNADTILIKSTVVSLIENVSKKGK